MWERGNGKISHNKMWERGIQGASHTI